MRIAIVQTDILWKQSKANADTVERLTAQVCGADIIVLPEMWDTGFAVDGLEDAEDAATRTDGATRANAALDCMRRLACRHDAAVCGSVATRDEDGAWRNRHYMVRPDGSETHYDKHHLFGYAQEDRHFKAGNQRVVATFRGVRFLLATCYDLRFPAWLRNTDRYDGIVCVANWPESRQQAWQTLLRARAIENQCYVVACNRTGTDPVCRYAGGSAIIDPYGQPLAEDLTGEQRLLTATIDLERLQRFRKKFPVLDDQDVFCIQEKS